MTTTFKTNAEQTTGLKSTKQTLKRCQFPNLDRKIGVSIEQVHENHAGLGGVAAVEFEAEYISLNTTSVFACVPADEADSKFLQLNAAVITDLNLAIDELTAHRDRLLSVYLNNGTAKLETCNCGQTDAKPGCGYVTATGYTCKKCGHEHSQHETLNGSIKDWYATAHPGDEEGGSISGATFQDLQDALTAGSCVYDTIGVMDSIVRERCFSKLAELRDVEYNTIYTQWLESGQ